MSSNKKGVTSRLVIPFLFVAHKNEGRSYLQEMSGVAGKFLVSHKKNVSVPNRNLCSAVLNIEIHQEKKQLPLRAESEVVTSAIKNTQLHKIIVVYKGTEMVVCEEV